MKRVLCVLVCIITLLCFKLQHFSFFELSESVSDGEIALTFINESLLLVDLENEKFLLSLEDHVSTAILKKYRVDDVPIYMVSEQPVIEKLNMSYHNDLQLSFTYASKKFCIGNFFDCDFIYLYKNDSYIDADVCFYNSKTANLLQNIDVPSYSVDSVVSILWDQKNYMILTY